MTVVLLRHPDLGVPADAVPALRAAGAVYAAGVDPDQLGAKPAPDVEELLAEAREQSIVLFAARLDDARVVALRDAGSRVIGQSIKGAGLLAAVDVMDRLRSPGGCPWDEKQTHESLRQYLVEETYELLEAIEEGDRDALREELGDVLLQVIFHARVAAEHPTDPFDLDAVAGELVSKLVGRHPHVFADATAEHHEGRWEELKQAEKRRESIVDGVALGQPAAALAGKLGQRSGRAGIPSDLFPAGTDPAAQLFRLAASARRSGLDPEGELRAVAKRFAADVRAAEQAARADGVDPATLEADGWRVYWPSGISG
ncbi:MazG family protein [Amycolatopsis taiwanensis]|uniref:Nucleoside triphosphate pyrophosphohydrolase n=1 Tax=Amycolatopsis taiwanensis TaxID=342230 RepID=A0A9W6QYL7_9PSEU|nr:MazG family protein [Amycolatopsis taiwanensis]GLY64360.1 nucleoside triphosphate pyrophosphohydrolase [Amycolatopsis taiwanensis]